MVQAGDVDAVSMRAIANAVGVTPPAIYAHFADKDELFQAICDRRFGQLNEALNAMDEFDDPVEGLHAGGRAYIRFGLDHPEAYRFLMATKTEEDYSETLTTDEPTQGDIAFMALVNKVAQCIEAGAIRRMDPLEGALILWSQVHGLTMLMITQPNFEWPEDLIDKLLDASMYGLVPR